MSSNKNKLRFIISSVLAFVLAVVFTGITYIGDLYFRGINETVLTEAVMKSNYAIELRETLYEESEAITLPIGLPVEVIEGIFDLEDIKTHLSMSLKATVNNKEYIPDTEDITTKLLENINAYLEREQLELSEEQEIYLQEYLDLIEEEYINNINLIVIEKAMPYWNSFMSYAGYAVMGMLVLAVIIIIVLFKLYHWRHKPLRFITYSTLAAFLMSVILPTALYISRFYERISVTPKYFYIAMVYILDEFFKFAIILGSFWALISALLRGTIRICKKNGYRRSSRHKSRH